MAGIAHSGFTRTAVMLNLPPAVMGVFILCYSVELRFKCSYLSPYIAWDSFKPSLRIRALSVFALIGMIGSFGLAALSDSIAISFILYASAISGAATHTLGYIDRVNVRRRSSKKLNSDDILFLNSLNQHLEVEVKTNRDVRE